MSDYNFIPNCAVHPIETLKEIMTTKAISTDELSQLTNLPLDMLNG